MKQEQKELTTNIEPIIEAVHLIALVDVNSPEAKLNITSISDNNGGRILL